MCPEEEVSFIEQFNRCCSVANPACDPHVKGSQLKENFNISI